MILFFRRLSFSLIFSIFFSFSVFGQSLVTTQLSKNLTNYLLKEDQPKLNIELGNLNPNGNNGDQVVNELYQRRNANAVSFEKLIGNFNANGTWKDINYNDKENSGWELKTHADRILLLTKVYLSKDSKYYRDKDLNKTIHQALDYWFKLMPQNKNWWYNQIGIPKTLGPVLIMLRSELSEQEYQAGLAVMNQSNFGMTGQNKVWLAGNMFYKALLTDNEKLAMQARDSIVSEVNVSENEGIKAEFSFQQHGPQQQFGNYGLAFITTMASWANIFANTSFALEERKLEILRNLFDKGYNQIVWKGYFDTNSLGRQFFKYAQEQKALATAFAAYDLMNVDLTQRPIYRAFIDRNFSDTNEPLLTGISNYYTSDMSVYRSKDWYNSIKMSSTRVIGAETGNDENLKGYYLGDGASYISITGKEYLDIFPLWNWRNLPGVTCFETARPLKKLTFKGYRNGSDFAGSLSSGLNGITAFMLNRDSLTAKKSYFFIGNQQVCLGTDINTVKNEPVVTTLNQTWLNGEVSYFIDKLEVLKNQTELKNQTLAWVFHDNTTYIPLNNTKIDFSNRVNSGSWSDIIAKYPKDSITGKIFTVKVSPVVKPKNASYAYAILPNYKPNADEKAVLSFDVLQNTKEAQIVKSKDNKVILMTVYEPFKKFFTGLGELDFKQAGLYAFEDIAGKWQITLADPTQKLQKMDVVFKGENHQFIMPDGLHKGKATQRFLTNK